MKSTTLFALFLLCAFTSYLPSATAQVVLDTDSDFLVNGGTYYILPAISGNGGGIEAAATGKETRPLTVVQSPDDDSKGLPIIISSPYRILQIYDGLILSLRFADQPPLTSWTVVEDLPEGPAVKLTGYKGTVDGWFKIEKASDDDSNHSNYKLTFCAIEYDKCGDIGVYVDRKGNRRLVVTKNDPLLVKFQKVRSSSA